MRSDEGSLALESRRRVVAQGKGLIHRSVVVNPRADAAMRGVARPPLRSGR
jgi:hypothetical protein